MGQFLNLPGIGTFPEIRGIEIRGKHAREMTELLILEWISVTVRK